MKKKNPWVFVILWMALIFLLSHQPATESIQLSSGITRIIEDMIVRISPDTSLSQGSLNYIIRKSAHFGTYLLLGLFVANALIASNVTKVKLILLAFLICVLYAISDEIHQLYVPGRSGQVSDVLIDSSGGLVGVLLYAFIRREWKAN